MPEFEIKRQSGHTTIRQVTRIKPDSPLIAEPLIVGAGIE